ncbi:hypothetical protein QLX08_011607 [Tetragonisca angustula]|uniref:Uncharacterized protein n=1 Tax=Tetragonisca angustula TaxID=166442 RepID=A0AAW0Z835_9HYME
MLACLSPNTSEKPASPPAAAGASPGAPTPRFQRTPISPLPSIEEVLQGNQENSVAAKSPETASRKDDVPT